MYIFKNVKRNGEDREEGGGDSKGCVCSSAGTDATPEKWDSFRFPKLKYGSPGNPTMTEEGKAKRMVSAFTLNEGRWLAKWRSVKAPQTEGGRERCGGGGNPMFMSIQAPGKSVWLTSANFSVTHSLIFAAFSWTIFASSALICFYKKERAFSSLQQLLF